ncbi:MAG: hydantoinase/oxoprolinase family protein, partial [Caulobacteraceae bacterium]
DQYDLGMDRAPPLVDRPLRWEIDERIAADGRVLRPLDEAGGRALAARLRAEAIESLAITLIHAYANSAHERRLAALIRTELPHLPISLSCEVSPEIREYERFVTTCANAYVQPLIAGYLTALSAELDRRGFRCPLFLVTSSGDLTDLATAVAHPVRLVESGPAGGAVLAARMARDAGLDEVLAFDMGGTTAKLCLIDGGKPQTTRSFEVGRAHRNRKGSGLPIRIPAIDLIEIGSGGGSIARVDALGRLLVGPRSAGATPGPVCYGRGGESPTVTDADLALGRLDPSRFSGDVVLDVDGASRAIADHIGARLALDGDLAAFAIAEIVDETMASAARVHAIESGKDVGVRAMIAFGGAGPIHAARVAQKLGVSRILIPPNAGVGSAIGFLAAGLAFEQAHSLFMPLEAFDAGRVNEVLSDMSAAARGLLGGEGHRYREARLAYMRYRGQGHEITVDPGAGRLDDAAPSRLRAAFEARYAQLFGRAIPDLAIEILTWTLRVERIEAPPPTVSGAAAHGVPEPERRLAVFDPRAGARIDYAVIDRAALAAGARRSGPCLISEEQTTTVVPSDFELEVAAGGVLLLTRKPGATRDGDG